MRISDLANRLGVSTSKIRYLESKGLIRPKRCHPNGYRIYDEEAAVRLAMMLQAQTLGFTLEEIVHAFTTNRTLECEPFIALLRSKLNEVKGRIQQEQALQVRLNRAVKEMRTRERSRKITGVQIIAPLDSVGMALAVPNAPRHRKRKK
jgi:MerR family transcriptional regulator, copper efflux regulator